MYVRMWAHSPSQIYCTRSSSPSPVSSDALSDPTPVALPPSTEEASAEAGTKDVISLRLSFELQPLESERDEKFCCPHGSGWRGSGNPMSVGHGTKVRPVFTGGGLPCPGRWALRDRKFPDNAVARAVRWAFTTSLQNACDREGYSFSTLLQDLQCGRFEKSPWIDASVTVARHTVTKVLSDHGITVPAELEPCPSPLQFSLMQSILEAFEDPDGGIRAMAAGVRTFLFC